MMCAEGFLPFCFRHATPSHCHHNTDLLTCIEHIRGTILEVCESVCWVYSAESVSKIIKLLYMINLPFKI